MNRPLVSINIVVFNGATYIRHCLKAVCNQTYRNYTVTILDNASTDGTPDIIEEEFPSTKLMRGKTNLGMWPGQEVLLEQSKGEYILALSVDVLLNPSYIENAIVCFAQDTKIASVQAKMLQWRFGSTGEPEFTKIIDTLGFQLTHARRLINQAHGEKDIGQYEKPRDIFGVEGAAPIFRRTALDACRIEGHITDPDYFWYGDDFDLAWRLTLCGWRQAYDPSVIAYHQRSTTTTLAHNLRDHLSRVKIRRQIPIKKRRLDWSNTRFTILKNDYILNILRDVPYILIREAAVFMYTLFFEPAVFMEVFRFFRLLPRMLKRRKLVMRMSKIRSGAIHTFFVTASL